MSLVGRKSTGKGKEGYMRVCRAKGFNGAGLVRSNRVRRRKALDERFGSRAGMSALAGIEYPLADLRPPEAVFRTVRRSNSPDQAGRRPGRRGRCGHTGRSWWPSTAMTAMVVGRRRARVSRSAPRTLKLRSTSYLGAHPQTLPISTGGNSSIIRSGARSSQPAESSQLEMLHLCISIPKT